MDISTAAATTTTTSFSNSSDTRVGCKMEQNQVSTLISEEALYEINLQAAIVAAYQKAREESSSTDNKPLSSSSSRSLISSTTENDWLNEYDVNEQAYMISLYERTKESLSSRQVLCSAAADAVVVKPETTTTTTIEEQLLLALKTTEDNNEEEEDWLSGYDVNEQAALMAVYDRMEKSLSSRRLDSSTNSDSCRQLQELLTSNDLEEQAEMIAMYERMKKSLSSRQLGGTSSLNGSRHLLILESDEPKEGEKDYDQRSQQSAGAGAALATKTQSQGKTAITTTDSVNTDDWTLLSDKNMMKEQAAILAAYEQVNAFRQQHQHQQQQPTKVSVHQNEESKEGENWLNAFYINKQNEMLALYQKSKSNTTNNDCSKSSISHETSPTKSLSSSSSFSTTTTTTTTDSTSSQSRKIPAAQDDIRSSFSSSSKKPGVTKVVESAVSVTTSDSESTSLSYAMSAQSAKLAAYENASLRSNYKKPGVAHVFESAVSVTSSDSDSASLRYAMSAQSAKVAAYEKATSRKNRKSPTAATTSQQQQQLSAYDAQLEKLASYSHDGSQQSSLKSQRVSSTIKRSSSTVPVSAPPRHNYKRASQPGVTRVVASSPLGKKKRNIGGNILHNTNLEVIDEVSAYDAQRQKLAEYNASTKPRPPRRTTDDEDDKERKDDKKAPTTATRQTSSSQQQLSSLTKDAIDYALAAHTAKLAAYERASRPGCPPMFSPTAKTKRAVVIDQLPTHDNHDPEVTTTTTKTKSDDTTATPDDAKLAPSTKIHSSNNQNDSALPSVSHTIRPELEHALAAQSAKVNAYERASKPGVTTHYYLASPTCKTSATAIDAFASKDAIPCIPFRDSDDDDDDEDIRIEPTPTTVKTNNTTRRAIQQTVAVKINCHELDDCASISEKSRNSLPLVPFSERSAAKGNSPQQQLDHALTRQSAKFSAYERAMKPGVTQCFSVPNKETTVDNDCIKWATVGSHQDANSFRSSGSRSSSSLPRIPRRGSDTIENDFQLDHKKPVRQTSSGSGEGFKLNVTNSADQKSSSLPKIPRRSTDDYAEVISPSTSPVCQKMAMPPKTGTNHELDNAHLETTTRMGCNAHSSPKAPIRSTSDIIRDQRPTKDPTLQAQLPIRMPSPTPSPKASAEFHTNVESPERKGTIPEIATSPSTRRRRSRNKFKNRVTEKDVDATCSSSNFSDVPETAASQSLAEQAETTSHEKRNKTLLKAILSPIGRKKKTVGCKFHFDHKSEKTNNTSTSRKGWFGFGRQK